MAGFVAKKLSIPVYSIGAGPECDGQLTPIIADLIGQFQAFSPKFVKKYADVATVVTDAMKAYVADVQAGTFPCRRTLLSHDRRRKRKVRSPWSRITTNPRAART